MGRSKLMTLLVFLAHMTLEARGKPTKCQFLTIKNCNKEFKGIFETKPHQPTASDKNLYCTGMQDFMGCLERTKCRGNVLDNYSYVVLQHGMMDKKLDICPNHKYAKLKGKVADIIKDHRFVDDIGADRPSLCAYQVHKRCVAVFTKNMETDSNMCDDVQSFINCYNQEAPMCKAPITMHFEHLCNKLGEDMLLLTKSVRGVMC